MRNRRIGRLSDNKSGWRGRAIRLLICLAGVAVLAAAGASSFRMARRTQRPLVATVADLQAVHLAVDLDGIPVRQVRRVGDGAVVKTDAEGRARLRLDDGTGFVVDGATRLAVRAGGIRLDGGRVFAQGGVGARTEVDVGGGVVAILTDSHAAFARPEGAPTSVYAASGELVIRSGSNDMTVRTGESARIENGQVRVEPEKTFEDWTGGLAVPWGADGRAVRSVGELWGRTSPGDVGSPLTIRSEEVSARFMGEQAETEVKATFFHGGSTRVEGDFRMAVPSNAIVASVSIGLGDRPAETKLVRGLRDSNAKTSPSTQLEWAGEGWLRGVVPAIPPGATVVIAVRYVEWLRPQTAPGELTLLQYRFPLASASTPPVIGEFSARIDTTGVRAQSVSAGLGASVQGQVVELRKSDFRPTADLVVEMRAQPFRTPARVYSVPSDSNDDPGDYVLVRAQMPQPEADPGARLVVVVDSSASVDPGMLDTEKAFVEAVIRSLGAKDQVLVLAADENARPIGPPQIGPASASRKKAIGDSMAKLTSAGASDLGRVLEEAADALGEPSSGGVVVYLGDGWPSMGDFGINEIRARLGRRNGGMPRLAAVAVGPTANRFGLTALVRGVGSVLEMSDRSDAAAAAATLMAEALQPFVVGAELVLGADFEQVYPLHPRTLPAGEVVYAVGRSRRSRDPKDVLLRWRDSKGAHEQHLAASREGLINEWDIRRRWGAARVEEIALRGTGREAASDVAVRTQLLTPWTAWAIPSGSPPSHLPTPLDSRILELAGGAEAIFSATMATPAPPKWILDDASTEGASANQDDQGALSEALGAAARRVVEEAFPSFRACRDSRAALRPDLSGSLQLRFQLDGNGRATQVRAMLTGANQDAPMLRCMEVVVGGLSFPSIGTQARVEVIHAIELPPGRSTQAGKCSATSELSVALRRGVWVERLRDVPPQQVYLQARHSCELGTWTDRRALLELILSRVQGVGRVHLARELDQAGEMDAASFLRREALRRAASPEEPQAIRQALLAHEKVPAKVFEMTYWEAQDNQARLGVVRKFLGLAPHDSTLRQLLLKLLVSLDRKDAVREEVARFRVDPVTDARLLAACASALRRIGDSDEARRVDGEIVERGPWDPWARAFAGDRLRDEGWFDEAARVYEPLERLVPSDQGVLIRSAMAHQGAGRTDLATRILGRVTQTSGRSHRAELGELASEMATVMLLQPRIGLDAGQRDELNQRIFELPSTRQSGVSVLLRTQSGTPIDATILRGPPAAREQRRPDVQAVELGLYRFALDGKEPHEVTLKLATRKQFPPSQPLKVRVDTLFFAKPGVLPELRTREVDLDRNGKSVELRWSAGQWVGP